MEVPALEDSALSQSIDAPSLGGPTLAVKASRPHAPTPTPSPPRQQDVSSTELQQPDSAESLIATPKSTDTPHINYYPGYGETPYIKTPLYIDYGINLHIGGTTFINRGCTVLDTPVSEVRIGERCSIGPNVSFFGVSHPLGKLLICFLFKCVLFLARLLTPLPLAYTSSLCRRYTRLSEWWSHSSKLASARGSLLFISFSVLLHPALAPRCSSLPPPQPHTLVVVTLSRHIIAQN